MAQRAWLNMSLCLLHLTREFRTGAVGAAPGPRSACWSLQCPHSDLRQARGSQEGHFEFTMELMFAALAVAASSGAMSLMNSVEGDSATEITS